MSNSKMPLPSGISSAEIWPIGWEEEEGKQSETDMHMIMD